MPRAYHNILWECILIKDRPLLDPAQGPCNGLFIPYETHAAAGQERGAQLMNRCAYGGFEGVALGSSCCYNMCMHNDRQKVDILIDYLSEMDEQELDRLQAAIDRRRGSLKKNKEKQSTVLERREYRHGLLQLEGRTYKRKKDGKLTERGPYWYFHYREGGRQRTLYIGKTGTPEAKVDEMMIKEGE